MEFWNGRAARAADIRLYIPSLGWQSSDDTHPKNSSDQTTASAGRQVESILLNVLNSTNLVVLTGTGSSFAASNGPGKPTPAGMRDVWEQVRSDAGTKIFDGIVNSFGNARVSNNIEKLLTFCKLYIELQEDVEEIRFKEISSFIGIAERSILKRVNFVDKDTNLDAHGALIQRVGRRGVRKPRSKLFTTNYDLCFEEAARRSRFVLIDGFSHHVEQTYDRSNFGIDIVRRDGGRESPDYIQNVLQFFKLHGSIDWRRRDGDIFRTMIGEGEPVLIYPRSSKYQESFNSPYLDMLSAFQATIREPDTALLVSGFGFNDDHISSPILSAIESNMSLRLVICDIGFIPSSTLILDEFVIGSVPTPKNKFLSNFMRLADTGDARVHLMNGRFQDLAVAMPDLVGETDRERHGQRMRALRETRQGTA